MTARLIDQLNGASQGDRPDGSVLVPLGAQFSHHAQELGDRAVVAMIDGDPFGDDPTYKSADQPRDRKLGFFARLRR